MAPVKINTYKWEKPPTSVYEDNYGYAINYYQPMIDYLNAKEKGIAPAVPPHLPWNNERGLEKYSHKNAIRSYSEEELCRRTNEAVSKSKRGLDNYQAVKRSGFSVCKAAVAANLAKHIQTESVQVKTRKKRLERAKQQAEEERIAMDEVSYEINKLNAIGSSKISKSEAKLLRGKSAKAIAATLLSEARNLSSCIDVNNVTSSMQIQESQSVRSKIHSKVTNIQVHDIDESFLEPLDKLKGGLKSLVCNSYAHCLDKSKQTSIEIEQLNARVVEAETKLKTEVTRIKKKLQIHITELELSLDVANKTNLDLQKTIKKQSLQLTELQAHYDEVQRQLQVTLDQFGIAQRRLQSLTGEIEEIRGNYELALRAKRVVEQQYEESQTRINELTVINVNLASSKAKIEQELGTVAADYDEITKELRISDERYQRVQVELKHTVEHLHEEQERIVKIDAIKKSLEIEVKNLSVRLEEVEANAIVGGKRIISKLEARMKDIELELDEEKRRHAETIKILRKKERTVKEVMIQCEEDQKNISLLQDSLEKTTQKVNIYKRQLQEQEGMSQASVTRVRRFQRELEAAEDRADTAESNLTLIRAKHRTFVTTSSVPGSQVYLVQESRNISE